MTHNDEQIDLLMRRFVRTGFSTEDGPDHLDADEMNAFAEGVLPPGARTRYVSHLANCDECRKQVAQLAIASGAVARVDQTVQNKPEPRGLWAALTGVFALPALRYVAFAAIAIVVASVGFFALRHRPVDHGRLVAIRCAVVPLRVDHDAARLDDVVHANIGAIASRDWPERIARRSARSRHHGHDLERRKAKHPAIDERDAVRHRAEFDVAAGLRRHRRALERSI